MAQIVEVNEEGGLYLPSELLAQLLGDGNTQPHARYVLKAQDGNLILIRFDQMQPFWATASPTERARAFHDWAMSHKDGPGLSDEALRRENIYD